MTISASIEGVLSKIDVEKGHPFRGGDQHACGTILRNMSNLLCLEQRIDGHIHPAGQRGAVHGNDGFKTLLGIDRDAIHALEPDAKKLIRALPRGDRSLGVIELLLPEA